MVVVLAVASPFSGTSDLIRLGQSGSDLGMVSLIRSEQPSPSQPPVRVDPLTTGKLKIPDGAITVRETENTVREM